MERRASRHSRNSSGQSIGASPGRRSLSAYPSTSVRDGVRAPLAPIPASPDVTEASEAGSMRAPRRGSNMPGAGSKGVRSRSRSRSRAEPAPLVDEFGRMNDENERPEKGGRSRSRSYSYMPRGSPHATQSLNAAVELVVSSPADSPVSSKSSRSMRRRSVGIKDAPAVPPLPPVEKEKPRQSMSLRSRISTDVFGFKSTPPATPTVEKEQENSLRRRDRTGAPASPAPPLPRALRPKDSASTLGKQISAPVLNEGLLKLQFA
jgi:hypothetical protein